MKVPTVQCNLCFSMLSMHPNGELINAVGVNISERHKSISPDDGYQFTSEADSEAHLCNRCWQELRKVHGGMPE